MFRNNDQSIKDVLQQFVNTSRIKPKLMETKVVEIWKETMGPTISKYTKDITLKNGKLYIAIQSSPLRQELSYGKQKIIDILNEKLGENCIQEVIIR